MNEKRLPDFSSAKERDEYITKHADYFVVSKFLGVGQYEKYPLKTQAQAVEAAHLLVKAKGGRWMIYASYGDSDVYIKTIA